ncbi:recombinase family protein [Riemerella columbina]|uniref:recombinase family protein n=1 Tax=Riemerella columbina TaxID=103810 RepID=UPI00036FA178|nr:recombinase family protein [Riemerella columbina]
MVYAYIRVSTNIQEISNQKYGIIEKSKHLGLEIEEWIEDDGVSGTVDPDKRMLGVLMQKINKGDVIICSEISRLGRKIFMIMKVLEFLMSKGVKLYTVKDNFELGDNIQSKVLAFAFGLVSELEREMIGKRTKEAVAIKKKQGVMLGNIAGYKKKFMLEGKEEQIQEMLDSKMELSKIAIELGCCRDTVARFIKKKNLRYKFKKSNVKQTCKHKRKSEINKYLSARKQKILELIERGNGLTEIARQISSERKNIQPHNVKAYLQKNNLFDYYVITTNRIRIESNKDSKNYNRELLENIIKNRENNQ